MTGRPVLKAGVDYPETVRLKAARIALVTADDNDPAMESYRREHREAFAEARALSTSKDTQ